MTFHRNNISILVDDVREFSSLYLGQRLSEHGPRNRVGFDQCRVIDCLHRFAVASFVTCVDVKRRCDSVMNLLVDTQTVNDELRVALDDDFLIERLGRGFLHHHQRDSVARALFVAYLLKRPKMHEIDYAFDFIENRERWIDNSMKASERTPIKIDDPFHQAGSRCPSDP